MTHDEKKARQAFVDAIRVDPRCWPAWESLALIIKEKNEVTFIFYFLSSRNILCF